MRKWILKVLRQPRLPERQVNYRRAWTLGRTDAISTSSGVVTEPQADGIYFDDEESQIGYIDGYENMWFPPVV